MGIDVQAAEHRTTVDEAPGCPYRIEGTLLATSEQPPAPTGPTAGRVVASVSAWQIGSGLIAGVDVSGQAIIAIRARPGRDGPVARLMLLDERATPEQVLALLDAFQGRLGGPLGTLVRFGDEDWEVSQVPITYCLRRAHVEISAPGRLRLVARLGNDRTDAGGSVGTAAADLSVDLPDHGLTWHDPNAAAIYRQFHVHSAVVEEGTCLT